MFKFVNLLNDEDYQDCLELVSEWCSKYKVQIWAYCLMPKHVHLIALPETKDGLNLAIGEAHRRYTRRINEGQNELFWFLTVVQNAVVLWNALALEQAIDRTRADGVIYDVITL